MTTFNIMYESNSFEQLQKKVFVLHFIIVVVDFVNPLININIVSIKHFMERHISNYRENH